MDIDGKALADQVLKAVREAVARETEPLRIALVAQKQNADSLLEEAALLRMQLDDYQKGFATKPRGTYTLKFHRADGLVATVVTRIE